MMDNRIEAIISKGSWKVGLDKINKEQLWKKTLATKVHKADAIFISVNLKNLIKDNRIDMATILQYFSEALKVYNGVQIKKIEEHEKWFSLELKLYGATQNTDNINIVPKYIYLNEDFLWFLGLWFGDRCGGKTMIGISSKEFNIAEKIYDFYMDDFMQPNKKITVVLEYNKEDAGYEQVMKNKFVNVGINKREDDLRAWIGFKVKFNNAVLGFLLKLIEKQLSDFLDTLDSKQIAIFMAGFFDAEGTVFRKKVYYTQKTNKNLIEIARKNLGKLGIETDYRDKTIHIRNSYQLAEAIYPFINIEEKKLRMKSLLEYGNAISSDDVFILWLINKLETVTSTRLREILDKSNPRTTTTLLALYENNMINRWRHNDNQPFEVSLTSEGREFLVNNKDRLDRIKNSILEYGAYGTGNKFKKTADIEQLLKVN